MPARRVIIADALACVGVALVVLGSFLPWVASGRVTRNGYAAAGVLRRLVDVSGAAGAALSLVPYLALVGAVGVACLLICHGAGTPATGWVGRALVLAVAAGSAWGCLAALTADAGYGVTLRRTGPVVALAGATLAAAASTAACGLALRRLVSHIPGR